MTRFNKPFIVATALLLGATAVPSMAAGSASSTASSGASASVGSLSDSVQGSSNSSSKATGVAEGDYRIIELASVAEQPGRVRLTLQALVDQGGGGEVFLVLPQSVLDQARLGRGGVVTARHRPYGIEFADGRNRQAFFLVLADDWVRELQPTAVVI